MSNDCYLELWSGFPTFDNANTALEALFFTALRWRFQVRFSSKTNSRELKDSFLQPVPILSISLFQIKSCFESPTRTYVFFLKSIYFVLETFRVGLFAFNQSTIFESSKRNHLDFLEFLKKIECFVNCEKYG